MQVPLPSDGVVRSLQKRTWWIMISSDQYQWSARTPWLNIGSIHIQGDQQRVRNSGDQGRDCDMLLLNPFYWVDTQSVVVAVKAHVHPYSSINPLQLNQPCPIMSYLLKGSMRLCRWTYMGDYGCIWFNLMKGPTHIKWPVKICVWLVLSTTLFGRNV